MAHTQVQKDAAKKAKLNGGKRPEDNPEPGEPGAIVRGFGWLKDMFLGRNTTGEVATGLVKTGAIFGAIGMAFWKGYKYLTSDDEDSDLD